MPEISRRRALAYAAMLLAVLVVAGRFVLGGTPATGGGAHTVPVRGLEVEPEAPRELVVHVVGAVHRPGLYRLRDGSRVDDAIRRAGGARPRAALELVNLAAPVADGQQVVVPARGSALAGASPPAGSPTGSPPGAPVARVQLNSASLEQLDALPGIGPVTAQKILFSGRPSSQARNGLFPRFAFRYISWVQLRSVEPSTVRRCSIAIPPAIR